VRRPKKPPTPETVAEATVVVDAIVEKRRDAFAADMPRLMDAAVGEYMRRYKVINQTGRPYYFRAVWADGEQHIVCFFCRESLNTLPVRKSWPSKMMERAERTHIEECAMRFLAGMFDGVPPPGYVAPKKKIKVPPLTSVYIPLIGPLTSLSVHLSTAVNNIRRELQDLITSFGYGASQIGSRWDVVRNGRVVAWLSYNGNVTYVNDRTTCTSCNLIVTLPVDGPTTCQACRDAEAYRKRQARLELREKLERLGLRGDH
jgi:hypothetical protein